MVRQLEKKLGTQELEARYLQVFFSRFPDITTEFNRQGNPWKMQSVAVIKHYCCE